MSNKGLIVVESTILFLVILSFTHDVVAAETADWRELIKEEGYNRMDRIATLLVRKYIRGAKKEYKLTMAERQIKERKNMKDVNLLKLMVAYGQRGEKDKQKAVYKFIANIFAIFLDTPLANDGEVIETKFGDFQDIFEKLKQLKAILENSFGQPKFWQISKIIGKKEKPSINLDTDPAPATIGQSTWGLVYMPKKGLEAKTLQENKFNWAGGKLRSYPAALDRTKIMVDFLLNAVKLEKKGGKSIFEEPNKFHGMVMEEWAKEGGKNKEEEEKGNTSGLKEIYDILAKHCGYAEQMALPKGKRDEKKFRAKLWKLLANFYLVIWHSFVNEKQTLKQYGKIYDMLFEVRKYYADKMAKQQLKWDNYLDEAKEQMKAKFIKWKKVLMEGRKEGNKGKMFGGEHNGKYAYISEEWGWIYASDNFFNVALETEAKGLKIGKLVLEEDEEQPEEGKKQGTT